MPLQRRTRLRSRGRRAIRRLQRLAEEIREDGDASDWEREFVEGDKSPTRRIERYGRAFRNPELGDLSEPLSARQWIKVKELERRRRE